MLGVGQFGDETEGVSSKWNCILCDIMICVCWELDSFWEETEGVSSKWNCILCDIMICVCWELDSLGGRLRG